MLHSCSGVSKKIENWQHSKIDFSEELVRSSKKRGKERSFNVPKLEVVQPVVHSQIHSSSAQQQASSTTRCVPKLMNLECSPVSDRVKHTAEILIN